MEMVSGLENGGRDGGGIVHNNWNETKGRCKREAGDGRCKSEAGEQHTPVAGWTRAESEVRWWVSSGG